MPPGADEVGKTLKGESMKTYGYGRASTDGQTITIDAQQEKVKAYCLAKGLLFSGFIDDPATSSRKPLVEREGGKRLVELIRKGEVKAVVVAKLDRAWRSVVECLTVMDEWCKIGVAVHILDLGVDTSTPQGRFFLTVLAAFAEMERSLISERTSTALQHAQANGKIVSSSCPYGYMPDANGPRHPVSGKYTKMIKQEKEQAIILEIEKMHEIGLKATEISKELNTTGYRQRNGKTWIRQSVEKLISKMQP